MNKPRDPVREPVNLAVQMFQAKLEHFRQQVIVPQQPQRIARLGEMPAEPIVQQVADLLAKE